ncbi:RND family transporter, partial [Patescibacteria group bacterium]
EADQQKAFVDQNDPLVVAQTKANELFGGEVAFIPFFVQSAEGNVLTNDNLQRINNVLGVFADEDIAPYLRNAEQIFPAQIPEQGADKAVAAQLRQFPPEIVGAVFSTDLEFKDDGTAAASVFLLSPGVDVAKLAAADIDPIDFDILIDEKIREAGEGLEIVTLANGVVQQEISGSNMEAGIFFGICLILIIILLAIIVRKIRYIVFSLVVIGMAIVWMFGLVTLFGLPTSMLVMFAPILTLALGIDYVIHFFARLREERETTDLKPAISTTVRHTGLAVFMAMITTAVAFGANAIAPSPAMIGFGLSVAIGVFVMFVTTFTVLPALVTWLGVKKVKARKKLKRPIIERSLGKVSSFLEKYSLAVVGLVVVGFVWAGWNAWNVDTTFDMKEFLAEDSQALVAMTLVEDEFGGTSSRQEMILLEGDVLSEELLDEVQTAAEKLDELGNVQTIFTYLPPQTNSKMATQILTQEMRPPQLESLVHYSEGGLPDAMRIVVALDPAVATEMETALATFGEATQGLENFVGIEYTATGQIHTGKHMVDSLNRALYQSVAIALVAAFILLWISLRRIGLALMGLVPVIFVAVMVVGSMTMLGISLNAITMLIASMSIGISVDFSIHILQRLSEELKRKKSMREAINTAVQRTGTALAETSITTFIGFGVLIFSSFAFFFNFGIVSSLMIVYSLIISLIFLPAVLWIRHRRLKKKEAK